MTIPLRLQESLGGKIDLLGSAVVERAGRTKRRRETVMGK